MTKRFAVLLTLAVAVFSAPAQEGVEDPNPMQLTVSHAGPAEYQPGQPVEITISIAASDDGSVTALGLVDVAPETWTFAGVRGITGDLPAVTPQPGSAGKVEFAWINMPQFPYTFAYTLQVPPDAAGDAIIQGQVEYRTNAGRQVTTPDFITIKGPANLPPRIELIGSPTVSIQEGNPYQDPGVTATDPEDGDLTSKVQVTGAVDTNTPGVYELRYDVKDKNGKAAPTVTRIVTVTPKPEENNTNNNNNNNGNNGGVNTPVSRNNIGSRVFSGIPGADGRVRDARLANTGMNGNANQQPATAPQPANRPTATDRDTQAAAQAQRANELARSLAQNGPLAGDTVPSALPPAPGPRTANMAKLVSNAAAPKPVTAEAEDLRALDDALGIASNTGETTADAATTNEDDGSDDNRTQVAAAAGGPTIMKPPAPRVPGMMERISLRINGLGRRELATIAASGIVLLGLIGFAAVAGRIAYAGPVRRKGNGGNKPLTAE